MLMLIAYTYNMCVFVSSVIDTDFFHFQGVKGQIGVTGPPGPTGKPVSKFP